MGGAPRVNRIVYNYIVTRKEGESALGDRSYATKRNYETNSRKCFRIKPLPKMVLEESDFAKRTHRAYQEGLFHTVAHTRFGAVGVGGHGPGLIIGKATTRGRHQSVLSKRLKPPAKWSYRKLIRWWVVVFLSIGWIVFYINAVTKNSHAVLSPPLTVFALLSAATLLLLMVLFCGHNRTTYKRRYSQWERSFLCQRRGTLTEQE